MGWFTRLLRRIGVAPECEWTHVVDGQPRGVCGRPAVCMITDTRCGHDTLVCGYCYQRATTTKWWHCRVCKVTTDVRGNPVPFTVWWPPTLRP